MGWLGWTYSELLECNDINAVLVGMQGCKDKHTMLIEAILGTAPKKEPKTKGKKFRAIVAEHNRQFKKGAV